MPEYIVIAAAHCDGGATVHEVDPAGHVLDEDVLTDDGWQHRTPEQLAAACDGCLTQWETEGAAERHAAKINDEQYMQYGGGRP